MLQCWQKCQYKVMTLYAKRSSLVKLWSRGREELRKYLLSFSHSQRKKRASRCSELGYRREASGEANPDKQASLSDPDPFFHSVIIHSKRF